MKKKRVRQRIGAGFLMMTPLLHCYLIIFLFLFARQIFLIIFFGAKALKWFTIPLIILYFTFLAAIGAVLWWRKERIQLMALMGEDLFYEEYPFDRWLRDKLQAWRKRRAEKKQRREKRCATSSAAAASDAAENTKRRPI